MSLRLSATLLASSLSLAKAPRYFTDALRQVRVGQCRQHAGRLGEAPVYRIEQRIEVERQLLDIRIVARRHTLAEIALDARSHDAVELCEPVHHRRTRRRLLVLRLLVFRHAGNANGVLAEHLDCGGHLPHLVALPCMRHGDLEIAVRQLSHGAGDPGERARYVPAGNDQPKGQAANDTHECQHHHCRQDDGLERGDVGLDRAEAGLIGLHYRIDLRLECFAVRSVLVVVAPGIGLGGIDPTEPRQFGAELLELRRPRHHRIERRHTCRTDQRLPGRKCLVDGGERRRDPFTERRGFIDGIGGIDTARIHHHGGDESVEMLAVMGARGRPVEVGHPGRILRRHDDGDAADNRDNRAHDSDDEKNTGLDLQGDAPTLPAFWLDQGFDAAFPRKPVPQSGLRSGESGSWPNKKKGAPRGTPLSLACSASVRTRTTPRRPRHSPG